MTQAQLQAPDRPRLVEVAHAAVPVAPPRLLALDAFRGFVVAGMLLVNNAALDTATPAQLIHAPWNERATFADLILPWFLFSMGVAIPFSIAHARHRGQPWWQTLVRWLRRGLSLFVLGTLLTSLVSRRLVLGLDVLQLLAAAYVIAGGLGRLPMVARAALAAALLAAHAWALATWSAPGVPAGNLKVGRNIVAVLNDTVFGPAGWRGAPSIPAATALTLFGTVVGDLLRSTSRGRAFALVGLSIGGSLLAWSGWQWSTTLPHNKALWTASYVVFAAGTGTVLLTLAHGLFDLVGGRFSPLRAAAWPLAVLGANPIVAYVAPIATKVLVLQDWRYRLPDGTVASLQTVFLDALVRQYGREGGGWAYTALYIGFWWLVLAILYVRRNFVRL